MAETPRPDKLELAAPKERSLPEPNYGYPRDRSVERRSPRDPYRRENYPDNRGRARTPDDFRRSRSPYRERRESGFPSNRGYSPGRGENNRTQYGAVSYTHLTLPTIYSV